MDPNEILERKLSREKAARLEAERLLEDKSRELFDQKQQLEKLNSTLESRVSAGTLKLQRSKGCSGRPNDAADLHEAISVHVNACVTKHVVHSMHVSSRGAHGDSERAQIWPRPGPDSALVPSGP